MLFLLCVINGPFWQSVMCKLSYLKMAAHHDCHLIRRHGSKIIKCPNEILHILSIHQWALHEKIGKIKHLTFDSRHLITHKISGYGTVI